ncbi:MAG: hypothetical protein Q8Q41_00650 [bacterium]|nr:hypothetical protein [bacterium]
MALEELEKELYKKEESEELKRRATTPLARAETPAGTLYGEQGRTMPGWRKEHGVAKERVMLEYQGPGVQTWRTWILWGSLGTLVVLTAISGYFIYQAFTVKDINLTVLAPPEAQLGKPFEVRVGFANGSDKILKGAKVSLSLPDGVSFLGAPQEQRNETRDAGDIGIGSMSEEAFSLIVLKDPQSVKKIRAGLSYAAIAGRSRFERSEELTLAVGNPAVQIDLRAPEKVFSGEEFETIVTYKNAADIDFSNLELRVNMPPTFNFKSSTVKPDVGNSLWRVGSLLKGSEGEFAIRGTIMGPEKSFFEIGTILTTSFLGKTYTIDTKAASLAISPSPLALTVLVNGTTDFVARPGDMLRYELRFTNNTDVGLRDVILRAKLVGEMFDFVTIDAPQIFFSSLTNTLTWNAANTPQLAVLEPGASGSVNFIVRLKQQYPIKRVNDKNFELKLEAQIESPTVPSFIGAEKTIGILSFAVKVAGHTTIDAQAFFRDAASGLVNKGPVPPLVNSPTNFTVHWVIANYATDVENVTVRAFLQSGVTWTGKVQSNINAIPVWNERTQEVSWTIDRIPATRGALGNPIEAIFQIEATPSINQLGDYMPLISDTELRAKDTFVNAEIVATDSTISTSLPDDPTVGQQGGIVRQ